MNYLDLGFTKFLTKSIFPQRSSSLQNSSSFSPGSFSNQIIGGDAVTNEKTKYNYRAFNAVVDVSGNGDFKKIQDAVEFVNSNGGGKILIKAGTYFIEDDIQLYTKIHLVGEGPGETILDFSAEINSETTYSLKLLGDSNDFSYLAGFSDQAKQNITIENIGFKNAYSDLVDANSVIQFRYIRNVNIRNCFFNACAFGITLTTCFPFTIEDCSFFNGGGDGVIISSGSGLVSNCVFNSLYGTHVYLSGGGTSSLINVDSCLMDSSTANSGIFISSGSNYKITNNQLVNLGYHAIRAGSSSNKISNSQIIGNRISNSANDDSGIYLENSEYMSIIGNIITGFDNGIYMASYASNNNQIIGNSVSGATGAGVRANSNMDRVIITNNDLEDCSTPINDSGATNVTKANNIIA